MEYDKMIDLIRDIASLLIHLRSENCEDEDTVIALVDESKRNLRTISVLVNDTDPELRNQHVAHDAAIAASLSNVARGSNFGGIGTTESKKRQYRHWQNNTKGNSPPIENHSLHYKAINTLAVITRLENGG